MTGKVRVAIVDDHPLFRNGVARTLEEAGRFTIVGHGGSADDALRLVREHRPDVILLDLSMPGGGLTAVRAIGEATPEVKIVVLTVSEADDDIIGALKAGAKGYVLKGVGATNLVEAILGIANGETYVSPALAGRLLAEMRGRGDSGQKLDDPLADLTPREEEILRLVGTGQSNKEIGRALDLQEKTVKHHMTRILSKLQVRNRTEAALLLREKSPPRPD